MYFVWYLLLGLASGWIANLIVKGDGSGLIINLIVGLVGGVLGGWLFSPVGPAPLGSLGSLATSVIGAVALLWIAAAITRKKITLKTDKTDTAEAENIETMELLTGMLDNATQCGGADDENPEPEKSGK